MQCDDLRDAARAGIAVYVVQNDSAPRRKRITDRESC